MSVELIQMGVGTAPACPVHGFPLLMINRTYIVPSNDTKDKQLSAVYCSLFTDY